MNNSSCYSNTNINKDFYPFGMVMPDRSYAAGTYRFGFNGKENDNEVKGTANEQDYGMRIYDTRLGKFLSVDPLTKKYPELTPFQFASNNPIQNIDLDGLEGTPNNFNYNISTKTMTAVNAQDNVGQHTVQPPLIKSNDPPEPLVKFKITFGGQAEIQTPKFGAGINLGSFTAAQYTVPLNAPNEPENSGGWKTAWSKGPKKIDEKQEGAGIKVGAVNFESQTTKTTVNTTVPYNYNGIVVNMQQNQTVIQKTGALGVGYSILGAQVETTKEITMSNKNIAGVNTVNESPVQIGTNLNIKSMPVQKSNSSNTIKVAFLIGFELSFPGF